MLTSWSERQYHAHRTEPDVSTQCSKSLGHLAEDLDPKTAEKKRAFTSWTARNPFQTAVGVNI